MISAEATFPVCHLSRKSVLAKGGNTTNLLSHLREHHPGLYSEPYPKNAKKGTADSTAAAAVTQPTLQHSIEQSAKYAAHLSIAQGLNNGSNILSAFRQLYMWCFGGKQHAETPMDLARRPCMEKAS